MKLSYDLYVPSGDQERNLAPIIILHGMLDSRKTWKYLASDISNKTGRKVYAVDARNHGLSPWSNDFTFDIIASDISDFLEQHGIKKAVFVGHSMGGRTALTLALKKPEKVEKLIVEDMVTNNFRPDQTNLLIYIIDLLKESLQHIPVGADELQAKKAIAKYLKSTMPQNTALPGKKSTKYDWSMIPLQKDGTSYSWQANLDILTEMLGTEKIRQNLSGVYMGDALFLYGTKSFFKIPRDKQISNFFPRAQKIPIEGASHLIHFEYPERFVEEVVSFINGQIRAKY